jgi:hypothetical protein
MKTILTILALLACAVSLPTLASDTVYKWKDASGRVHFSDRPLHDADSEEMKVSPSRSAAADDEFEESEESEETAEDEEAATETPDKAARQAEMEKQQKQIREQNCTIARQTLEHNESIERMYRVDSNGERMFLSDEEREMVLDRSRQDVEKWCD